MQKEEWDLSQQLKNINIEDILGTKKPSGNGKLLDQYLEGLQEDQEYSPMTMPTPANKDGLRDMSPFSKLMNQQQTLLDLSVKELANISKFSVPDDVNLALSPTK